jgi:hypothetical protein
MKREHIYQREKKEDIDEDLPGYPEYSEDEDIYNKAKEEGEIDPENILNIKESLYDDDLDTDEAATNLDIPGTEFDDDLEDIGSEDEENNFYSLSDNDEMEDLI